MKIAVDARTLGSRPSGVGMYLNDFLKQLMKYEDLEFVLISDVAESEYIKSFIKNGIKVYTKGKQETKTGEIHVNPDSRFHIPFQLGTLYIPFGKRLPEPSERNPHARKNAPPL